MRIAKIESGPSRFGRVGRTITPPMYTTVNAKPSVENRMEAFSLTHMNTQPLAA